MSRRGALREALSLGANVARAHVFPAPVLVSLDPRLTLVGFSVTARNGLDVCVETSHVDPSRIDNPLPPVLAVRVSIQGEQPDVEWQNHVLDYLLGMRSFDETACEDLLGTIAASFFEGTSVLIDGRSTSAVGFRVGDDHFARVSSNPAWFATVAGPAQLFHADFTTQIRATERAAERS